MSDLQTVKQSIDFLIDEMRGIECTNQGEYDFLGSWIKKNKDSQKIVTEFFEPSRVAAKEVYDKVLEDKKQYLKPLEESDKIARAKMAVYATEQEKLRQSEIREKQAEARRIQEEQNQKEAKEALERGEGDKALDALLKPIEF
jgi:hypothetical protein